MLIAQLFEAYDKWPEQKIDGVTIDPFHDMDTRDTFARRRANTPTIGPHQDREMTLMLLGMKPAAMVEPERLNHWQTAIRENGWIARRIMNGQIVITLRDQAYRIDLLNKIYLKAWQEGRKPTDVDHVKIGRLLGYSKDEIRDFLVRLKALSKASVG